MKGWQGVNSRVMVSFALRNGFPSRLVKRWGEMSLWFFRVSGHLLLLCPGPTSAHTCPSSLQLFAAHHDISFSHVWENSGPLASERDTDTRQVLCAGAILRSCKYGNFLCLRVSHISKDRFTLLTTSFKHSTPCCHMLDFITGTNQLPWMILNWTCAMTLFKFRNVRTAEEQMHFTRVKSEM